MARSGSGVPPPNTTSVTIIATFHVTGARYDSRNRLWLFSTPRHQADRTSRPAPGNSTRTIAIVRSRFSPVKPGAITALSAGVATTPARTTTETTSAEQGADGTRHAVGFARLAAREQRRVHRNERRGQRPFAEQVLEEVGDAETGGEGVGGVALQAEIVREDPLPDEAGKPADENAGGDEERPATASRARQRSSRLVEHHRPAAEAWPSVPLDFFIK